MILTVDTTSNSLTPTKEKTTIHRLMFSRTHRLRSCTMPSNLCSRWTPTISQSLISSTTRASNRFVHIFHVVVLAVVVAAASTLLMSSDKASVFLPPVSVLRLPQYRPAPELFNISDLQRPVNEPDNVLKSVGSIEAIRSVNGRSESSNHVNQTSLPPTLPRGHVNADLLNDIRAKTKLVPRWPSQNLVDVRKLRSYGPAYSSIVVSQKLKVVYIPVFKVGTTSMMWNIAFLENNTHVLKHSNQDPSELQHFLHDMSTEAWKSHSLCHMTDDEISQVLSDPSFLKFTFVRNPYSRLVSAFVDKVHGVSIDSMEYQRQMYALFGNDLKLRKAANDTRLTFDEYVRSVHKVLLIHQNSDEYDNDNEAFEDNSSRRDVHWRPQIELVHPDIIPVDFVGRFEHIERDQSVVLDWMYRQTFRRMPQEMSVKMHSSDPVLKQTLIQQLHRNIELQKLVYQMYEEDFIRFQFATDVPLSLQ